MRGGESKTDTERAEDLEAGCFRIQSHSSRSLQNHTTITWFVGWSGAFLPECKIFLEMSAPKLYVGKLWWGDIQIWILYRALQNPSSTSEADPTPAMFSRRLPRLCLFSGNDLSHSHSPPMCSRVPFFSYHVQIDATGTPLRWLDGEGV